MHREFVFVHLGPHSNAPETLNTSTAGSRNIPRPLNGKAWCTPQLALNQPGQGLFTILESGELATRIFFQVLLEVSREILCPYPCRFPDVGFVEDRAFLDCPNSLHVKRCLGEIRKQQHRTAWLDRHIFGNCPCNLFDFTGRAVRKISKKNLFSLMGDESDSFIHGRKTFFPSRSLN